jgi:hypothetical protein
MEEGRNGLTIDGFFYLGVFGRVSNPLININGLVCFEKWLSIESEHSVRLFGLFVEIFQIQLN